VKTCTKCKKEFSLNFFYKKKERKDGHSSRCKKCELLTSRLWANSEKGFINRLFIRINAKTRHKRFRNLSEKEKNKHRCYVTKEKFINLWELHKKKYGYTCALTGVEIIPKTTSNKEINKSNSISVDRLNPAIGYTEENIIFVSNKVNQMKSAVTKELCIAIIKAYEEKGL